MPKKGDGWSTAHESAAASAITDRLLDLARVIGRTLARQHAADAKADHEPKPDLKSLEQDR